MSYFTAILQRVSFVQVTRQVNLVLMFDAIRTSIDNQAIRLRAPLLDYMKVYHCYVKSSASRVFLLAVIVASAPAQLRLCAYAFAPTLNRRLHRHVIVQYEANRFVC